MQGEAGGAQVKVRRERKQVPTMVAAVTRPWQVRAEACGMQGTQCPAVQVTAGNECQAMAKGPPAPAPFRAPSCQACGSPRPEWGRVGAM